MRSIQIGERIKRGLTLEKILNWIDKSKDFVDMDLHEDGHYGNKGMLTLHEHSRGDESEYLDAYEMTYLGSSLYGNTWDYHDILKDGEKEIIQKALKAHNEKVFEELYKDKIEKE